MWKKRRRCGLLIFVGNESGPRLIACFKLGNGFRRVPAVLAVCPADEPLPRYPAQGNSSFSEFMHRRTNARHNEDAKIKGFINLDPIAGLFTATILQDCFCLLSC